jgi:hypothetical protein
VKSDALHFELTVKERKSGAHSSQRNAHLVNTFGVATVLGRWLILQEMTLASSKDCGDRVIERDIPRQRGGESLRARRRNAVRKRITTLKLAFDAPAEWRELEELERKLIELGWLTLLQLDLDFAERLFTLSRYNDAFIEGKLDNGPPKRQGNCVAPHRGREEGD